MSEPPNFPPIRACIFDCDGLLIDSEDIYTRIYNTILHEYGASDFPWTIKAKQASRGAPMGINMIISWSGIPLTYTEWRTKQNKLESLFSTSQILPGVATLLENLQKAKIYTAVASSARKDLYEVKTSHVPALSSATSFNCKVFGDDPEMGNCEKKPSPDIFLLALKRLNEIVVGKGEKEIKAEECVVFEDSVAGVEAGRRAGMRVVWVPHVGLRKVTVGREQDVLIGRTEVDGEATYEEWKGAVPEVGKKGVLSEDGWARMLMSLEDFEYGEYGVEV